MTIPRLIEMIGFMAFFGAISLVLAWFGEDALGIEPGPWFWFYVAFLLPQMVIWNSAGAYRRYGGSFTQPAPSSD